MILHKLVVIDAELSPMGKVMAGPTISCLMWNGGGGGVGWGRGERPVSCAALLALA